MGWDRTRKWLIKKAKNKILLSKIHLGIIAGFIRINRIKLGGTGK